jgi:UDP-N-acetylglucosamine 4,6-dehydratase
MRYFLGDVRDADRLRQAMRGIDYVVHAAALKQVPAAEYNPTECIRTNVNGAENIIAAAIDNGVKRSWRCPPTRRPARSTCTAQPSCCRTSCSSPPTTLPVSNKRVLPWCATATWRARGFGGAVLQQADCRGAQELPITDERMTRFWITLDHGVQFVLDSFARMHGGEVFVPKIPSIRIVDLALGMAEHLPHKNVGIRPGEKLHELMVPLDDARMTLEFEDHYTIQPSIRFTSVDVDFAIDKLGEHGRPVSEDFEYRSDTNPHYLSVGQIAELHAKLSA